MTSSPAQGQPFPQQPAAGQLRLHLQGNMFLSMITPTVKIDGYAVPVKYGENLVPVVPGRHLVAANAQWLWKYGQAQQEIVVEQGQTAELWYAPPLLTFIKGAMGPTKQKMPGVVGFAVFMAAIVLLVVLIAVLGS